jgi:nucleoside-diphosphate-sugar epimerase
VPSCARSLPHPASSPSPGCGDRGPGVTGSSSASCDATDAAALDAALQSIPFAVCSVLGNRATMAAATRNLCDAARWTGMRRIVLLSTMAVYGPATGLVDETAPLDGSLGAYGAAKVECERVARAFVEAGGAATTLRPGIVYGPGGEQWIGRLGRLLRAGRVGDLGALGDGACNLIYGDDLGAAVVAALSAPGAAGEAINLAEPDPVTWNEVFTELGCAIGVPYVRRLSERRLRVEAKLLAPDLQAAKVVGSRLGLRPGILPDPIPPSLLRLWQQEIRLDHRKADALPDFPRTLRATGLARAAEWFLAQERGAARLAGAREARA